MAATAEAEAPAALGPVDSMLAAMEGAAVGTTFTIAGSTNVWTKIEGGLWDCGSVVVPARTFRGYIANDLLTLNTRVVEADGTEKVVTTPEVREVIPESLKEGLLRLASLHPSSELTQILTAHALPVPVRTDFTITMRGTAQWAVPRDAAANYWTGRNGVRILAVSGRTVVDWERQFVITRLVTPDTCICESLTMDEADIAQFKPTTRRETTDVVVREFNRQCPHGSHNWMAQDEVAEEADPF